MFGSLISEGQLSGEVCLGLCLNCVTLHVGASSDMWTEKLVWMGQVFHAKEQSFQAVITACLLACCLCVWCVCERKYTRWRNRTRYKLKRISETRRTATRKYDFQSSKYYYHFALGYRKHRGSGKVYHVCLPFHCVFHFEFWIILPLI